MQRVRVAQQQRVLVDAGTQATTPPDRLHGGTRAAGGPQAPSPVGALDVGVWRRGRRRRRRAQRGQRGAQRGVVRRAASGRGQSTRAPRAIRAGVASSVLPDAVGQPQHGQRRRWPAPAAGSRAAARGRRRSLCPRRSRNAAGPLASRARGRRRAASPCPSSLPMYSAHRARVFAAASARRHSGVCTLEAGERRAHARPASRPCPSVLPRAGPRRAGRRRPARRGA